MDADSPVPLPEEVARELSSFHRLMRWRNTGFFVLAVVLLALAIQPLFVVAPLLLFLAWIGVFSVRGMQRFYDLASGLYMVVIMTLVESLFGVHIRTFGHKEKFKRRSLFVMNHTCHVDWFFFWGVLERNGDVTCWKAITKNIRRLPFMGLCMQYMNHISISRRWEKDKEEFKKKLFYYNTLQLPLQLLLFPEGGDLTKSSQAKSHSYADTNKLERYEYCLHPRAKGFLYVMEALRSGRLDAVYDITVGFPDALPKTELDFLKGYIPREIHYNIRHYRAEDLPTDEEALTEWLNERWREKEKELKLFYTHRHFVELDEGSQATNNGVSLQQNGPTEFRSVPEVVLPKPHRFTLFAFAFYIFWMVSFTYLLFLHWVWWICAVCTIVFTFVRGLGSGIDTVLPNKISDRIEATYLKWRKMKEAVTGMNTHKK